jgi:AcrR family transcriptional regulator
VTLGFPSDFEKIGDTQKRIIVESEKVLGKLGVGGMELKSIAKTLQTSPGNIHHYYKTGEELILDTTLYSYKKYVKTIQEVNKDQKDPEKVLRSWIDSTLKWTTEYPGIGVILEFPQLAIRSSSKHIEENEEFLGTFLKSVSEIGSENVMYLASAIRSLQKKQDFKEFGTIQIAAYIKTDAKFATFTSLIGFATLGAGLWLAGRQAANTKFPFWLNFGFDPQTQMKNSIETAIKMIKAED